MTDIMENVAAPEGAVPTTTPLIGVVVVTHGQLATELVNAAEMIVGDLPQFAAVSIGWHDDVETAKEAIAAAITHVVRPAGVIVLTDMFGGTPSNLGMTFFERDRVEVVTGVNLPMLIKLAEPAAVVESAGGRAADSRRWPQRHLGRLGFDARHTPGSPRAARGAAVRAARDEPASRSERAGHARPRRRAVRAAGCRRSRRRSGSIATGGRSTARASWDCSCSRPRAARRLLLAADGPDELAALDALTALVERGFDEE